MARIENLQAKWDDIITEKEVINKLKISQRTLRNMRKAGKIKYFSYLLPSTTGNAKRPGKNPVYSIKELAELFSPVV